MESFYRLAPPTNKDCVFKKEILFSTEDLNKLNEKRTVGLQLNSEQFDSDLYLDDLIFKPWGYEYRTYADSFNDMWHLKISPGQSTSMHCHPRKKTVLLCLEGTANFYTLTETHALRTMDFVLIHKGAFHATENIGDSVLELVEIESPRNKFDLVRVKDKYGRQGLLYETQTLERKLAAIERIDLIADAKIRTNSIDNKYRFGVKTGMDIICRPDEGLIFIVSLGLNDAIAQDIQVFPAATTPIPLEQDNLYFTIGHNL